MQFTLFQVLGIFVTVYVAWWAIKHLLAIYVMKHLEKKRFCLKCLDEGNGEVVLNAKWRIITSDNVPIFLCDICKEEDFPGEIAEFAIKRGFLRKETE